MNYDVNPEILKVQNNARVAKHGDKIIVAKLDIRLTNARDRTAALDFCKVIIKEVKAAEKAAKKRAALRAKK